MLDRRNALLLGSTALVGVVAAGCTQQQVDNIAAALAGALDKIQSTVKAACGLVPAATSVLEMILTALNVLTLTAAAQIVETVLNVVIEALKIACPVPTPNAADALVASTTATVGGKSVPVKWY